MAKKMTEMFDGKALIDALKLPKGVYITIDPEGGFLTVGLNADIKKYGSQANTAKQLEKGRKIFQSKTSKWTAAEFSAVRDLFQAKSSKTPKAAQKKLAISAPGDKLPIEPWCMKCKSLRTLTTYEVVENARGGKSGKGMCPICGTQVYKFLPRDTVATSKAKPKAKKEKAVANKATRKAIAKSAKVNHSGKITVGSVARFFCGKCKNGVDVKVASITDTDNGHSRAHGKCPTCKSSIGRGLK